MFWYSYSTLVFEPIWVRHSKANFENVDTPAFSTFLSSLMKYHCFFAGHLRDLKVGEI